MVSVHVSSLSGLLKCAHGPWYSCAITPDDKLLRLDPPYATHLNVLDFFSNLERDAKEFSAPDGENDTILSEGSVIESPLPIGMSQSHVWL